MKKGFYLFLAITLSFSVLISCKNKTSHIEEEVDPEFIFSKSDTTQVMDLVNQFCSYMKEGNVKNAIEMLHFLNGDSIVPLDNETKRRQGISLMIVSGKSGYQLDRIVFQNNKGNEAKIDITLFEKEEGDPRPNTTSFYLRPVRFEGQWYLTTKDNISDTNTQSELNRMATDKNDQEDL